MIFNLSICSREVSLFSTSEEALWVGDRLGSFSATFSSVSMGDESIRDILMYSCVGEPLSKSYCSSQCNLFMERGRRVLLAQPELRRALTAPEVARLCASNVFRATAVFVAKIDGFQCFEDQVREKRKMRKFL